MLRGKLPIPDYFMRSFDYVAFLIVALILVLAGMAAIPATAAPPARLVAPDAVAVAVPDPALAAALFSQPAGTRLILTREDQPVPLWRAAAEGRNLGLIGSTWEIAASTGYSGRPLDVLVAVDPQGVITGARLMRQTEPVLTLGISEADIAAYVNGFTGYDIEADARDAAALPDVISRATVSTGVIRDGILRTARVLATAQGLGAGPIDRVSYVEADWQGVLDTGALTHRLVTMSEAATVFAGAAQPPTPSNAPFLEFWTGLIDTPTVGRNLLGQQAFTAATGPLGPDEVLLALFSRGVFSHRGTEWKRSGQFERITISQGNVTLTPTAESYTQVHRLGLSGAPEFKERSVFRLSADPARGGIDVTQPFTVTVTATRPAANGTTISLPISAEVTLPEAFRLAPAAPPTPLWLEFWMEKKPQIAVVGAMLAVLALILFGQEWLVRRPAVWRRTRLIYLAVTLFVLGWGFGAQLSIVQVMAFLHALLDGFRWETFLIAPLIFILWSCVALGMLFWGRGVFCGWLCPFGALQELTNAAAQKMGVRQIAVRQSVHERLWVIKYSLFVGLVALSFYSMEYALIAAEVEPFKTAISMRFMRAWPFVLYVFVLLGAGLFIERFFCRYLCPLGAGLAIPAKLKVFDWLKRRPQCGRECRLCETKCPVGAIDPLGRINANECVMCLRCQTIMDDPTMCPVLKRRARAIPPGPPPGTPPPLVPTQVPSGAHAGAAAEAATTEPLAFQPRQVTP